MPERTGIVTRAGHICMICSFIPTTKNKYRELQDHLVRKHFNERIKEALPTKRPYICPEPGCTIEGKDWQALMRHFTGKHGVLERFLRDVMSRGLKLPPNPKHVRKQQKKVEEELARSGFDSDHNQRLVLEQDSEYRQEKEIRHALSTVQPVPPEQMQEAASSSATLPPPPPLVCKQPQLLSPQLMSPPQPNLLPSAPQSLPLAHLQPQIMLAQPLPPEKVGLGQQSGLKRAHPKTRRNSTGSLSSSESNQESEEEQEEPQLALVIKRPRADPSGTDSYAFVDLQSFLASTTYIPNPDPQILESVAKKHAYFNVLAAPAPLVPKLPPKEEDEVKPKLEDGNSLEPPQQVINPMALTANDSASIESQLGVLKPLPHIQPQATQAQPEQIQMQYQPSQSLMAMQPPQAQHSQVVQLQPEQQQQIQTQPHQLTQQDLQQLTFNPSATTSQPDQQHQQQQQLLQQQYTQPATIVVNSQQQQVLGQPPPPQQQLQPAVSQQYLTPEQLLTQFGQQQQQQHMFDSQDTVILTQEQLLELQQQSAPGAQPTIVYAPDVVKAVSETDGSQYMPIYFTINEAGEVQGVSMQLQQEQQPFEVLQTIQTADQVGQEQQQLIQQQQQIEPQQQQQLEAPQQPLEQQQLEQPQQQQLPATSMPMQCQPPSDKVIVEVVNSIEGPGSVTGALSPTKDVGPPPGQVAAVSAPATTSQMQQLPCTSAVTSVPTTGTVSAANSNLLEVKEIDFSMF